ncbi:MAG: two pore domain potassium channel family protein [Candidatus Lokiarchaeota archaeon]|nr:two pore domain potassium channel family protein [Candidatus Lokiarchaeota archaeon]
MKQIENCLYFSTVTFATLGLKDFRTVEDWSRIFAGTEAFIGALVMVLLVYTFARRTGGR